MQNDKENREDKKSKDFNEDKFTWQPGDLTRVENADALPNVQRWSGVEKKRRKIVWGGGIIYEGNGGDNKEEKK